MIIAVASEGTAVGQHFGHCEGFWLFECKNDAIVSERFVKNPGHKPGFLPVFLHDAGADVIISGGMGGGAIDIFNQKGVEVVTGATGEARGAAADFLSGRLKPCSSVCREHSHDGGC
jgi:predicted Fe-Mo cluster-binding NifX family protein